MTDTLIPDVSEFQSGNSAPNWAGIKSRNGGAGIMRVGYGLGFPNTGQCDRMFVSNYTAVKQLDFSFIGLYHYLRSGQDALAQAKQFCNWVGPPSAVYPGTVFILDLEEGSGNQSGRANTWFNYVDNFYGLDTKPLNMRSWLYSGASFASTQGLAPIFSSARHTWVAAYGSIEPGLPHTLWQSTNGSIGSHITSWPGCGAVDTSIAHYSLSQLAAMGWSNNVVTANDNSFHGEYVTGGMFDLADLADKLGYPVNTLLRMTAVHYQTFGNDLGQYISDVFTGAIPPTTPVPAGVNLWCD